MTTARTHNVARRLTMALGLTVALAPAAWAGSGAKGTMTLSINLVGPGWEQLAAKNAGGTPSAKSLAQAAVARALEPTQSSLQRVYSFDEVRRILDQVEHDAVLVDGGTATLATDDGSAWLVTGDGTVHSL